MEQSIGWAIKQLHNGNRVARSGWNGKNMWLALQIPDPLSKMTEPYVYIEYPYGSVAYPKGSRVPWLPSQTDLLAVDWFAVGFMDEPADNMQHAGEDEIG